MRRVCLLLSLLVGCGGDDDSGPKEITVETYNVALAGSFIPFETERRTAVLAAIAGMPSDVACLTEVWEATDKVAVKNAAMATFPHSASFEHNLNTAVDDPNDANGVAPPVPTTAPCGQAQMTRVNAAIECLKTSCSTVPGSEDGKTTSFDCASSACAGQALPLLTGNAADKKCYGCVVSNVPAETFSEIRSLCTTQPNGALAFGGQSGTMVLSKHPIESPEVFVLPGTWNRRVIVKAPIRLRSDLTVDVYCTHISPIFTDFVLPYTGDYGGGATDFMGWATEQKLQAEKLNAYVSRESPAGRPVIMMGDLNAGREFSSGGTVVVHAEGVETMVILERDFTMGVVAGYMPKCTHCPDNGVNTEETSPVWIDHIWLKNIPVAQVTATTRTFDMATVSVTGPEGPKMVHPSDHYGIRATISMP